MTSTFFEKPVLNSPYACPDRHWQLENGQPTGVIVERRRRAEFITPIPRPRKQTGRQADLLDESLGLSRDGQKYDPISIVNEIRQAVNTWRELPRDGWQVTPETGRLLEYWRGHEFQGARPFFCQIEAVETAIWLAEVAPRQGKKYAHILESIRNASLESNPGLIRTALKLATGAGKTTVMALIIAWQTINAVRHPASRQFTRGFLIVTPGITIRDRLRVLLPNDPDSYYKTRELAPSDMLADMQQARIIITNYHAFKLRERMELRKGTRELLSGRTGEAPRTLETEGQMLQRVIPELLSMKNILIINDEAHHCYRAKPETGEKPLKGYDRKEAENNNEVARLWISGLEIIQRRTGIARIFDLSATPFFLRGSGYAEGTLFPWTVSDFSLMDAIESGIVKLPRVPVTSNIPGEEMPMYRNLWEHIGKKMPKKGRGKSGALDPLELPLELQTALEALYGHYEETFRLWERDRARVPPCFIIICNNTASSKLVYDYISGFMRKNEDGSLTREQGRLPLFRNHDEYGEPLARPRTLLIDSEQLESGEALDKNFRDMAAPEIERFRQEIIERDGNSAAAENLTDPDLLREVMNTVGKIGRLGESIRCVVSVSMLTEGWDANTVTHILGLRAFGTQLLCEQVMGRALRRYSYDLNEEGLFDAEYADIFGIPFDFTAKPRVTPPQPPRETVLVKAMRPERDHLEICFPRVAGYRVELPREELEAEFSDDSRFILTPALVGPSETSNAGIIGATATFTLERLKDARFSTLLMKLATHFMQTRWRDSDTPFPAHLFGPLKRITREWLENYLECQGGTSPAQLMYKQLADQACQRIFDAINRAGQKKSANIKALLDPYNASGSTRHVQFRTSRADRWETCGPPPKCHVNWAILESDWEGEFCRVLERHPRVIAYIKNQGLDFSVPYRHLSVARHYFPDFILLVDDGHGKDEPLRLVVEIKGYRGEDAKDKKAAMETCWIPGVNALKSCGRWAFAEFTNVWAMQENLAAEVEKHVGEMLDKVIAAGDTAP